MLITKLFRRRFWGGSVSSLENLEGGDDHVFELKRMILDKYSTMMRYRRSEREQVEDRILVESSFINDSFFLPPLFVNRRSGAKLTKLDFEQVQFLLMIILYNQPLSHQEEFISRSSRFCLKGQYILIVEQMVKSLMLSKKQKRMVVKWKKLSSNVELFPTNHFVDFTSSNIIQGFIGDCSLIVVLSLLLEHEKRFNSSLLSSLISPIRFSVKSQQQGGGHLEEKEEDVGSLQCGGNIGQLDDVLCLYRCKLLINGIWRSIFVDSLIPIDSGNSCLLSHFENSRYYGITLMEKAYLKVMANRYDSIESNPAIDLYYLTEWIPETISIKSNYDNKRSFFSKLWNRIKKPIQQGYCLMALGTNEIRPEGGEYGAKVVYAGQFEDREEESSACKLRREGGGDGQSEYKYIGKEEICRRTGLVTRHAYQVLRIVELFDREKEVVHRLLLLRNPWGKISWKGRFSKHDKESWSGGELQGLLGNKFGYEVGQDNGIFWIEWGDILSWFSHIYLAWDPERVSKFVKKVHGKWSPCPHESILRDDLHLTYFYPQYKLSIDCKLLNKLKMTSSGSTHFGHFGGATGAAKLKLLFDSSSDGGAEEGSRATGGGLFARLWRKSESLEGGEGYNSHGDIWIVLNRHIAYLGMDELGNCKAESEVNSIPFMSISIFRGRNRIITQERLPLMQGVYSNGSVIMFKTNIFKLLREYDYFDLQENKDFILVITQYQSRKAFNYTLNIYSNVEISVKLLDCHFQSPPPQQSISCCDLSSSFVQVTGKILHHNFCERYYISLSKNSKLKLVPAVKNKQFISKASGSSHHSTPHLPNEQFRLLILLELKERCSNYKLRLFPETFDGQDKIVKLSSSNDAYNNSNCKFIVSICSHGNYFILIDFKEKQQDFVKGNIFKLVIYYQKL